MNSWYSFSSEQCCLQICLRIEIIFNRFFFVVSGVTAFFGRYWATTTKMYNDVRTQMQTKISKNEFSDIQVWSHHGHLLTNDFFWKWRGKNKVQCRPWSLHLFVPVLPLSWRWCTLQEVKRSNCVLLWSHASLLRKYSKKMQRAAFSNIKN